MKCYNPSMHRTFLVLFTFFVFIFLELNPAKLPWWVILNNESTIEEILKSLAGSTALILAVPITTLLAAWVALKKFTPIKPGFKRS